MNVVPTRRTRTIAAALLTDARRAPAADAVLRHLGDLEAEQIAALVALLIDSNVRNTPGPHPRRAELTTDARLRGYSQYRQGLRNDFTRRAYREYVRLNKQAARAKARGAAA